MKNHSGKKKFFCAIRSITQQSCITLIAIVLHYYRNSMAFVKFDAISICKVLSRVQAPSIIEKKFSPPAQHPVVASLAQGAGGAACRVAAVAGRRVGQRRDRTMVKLDNLTVSYRQHPALHHITGQFADGSLTAVVGPNGAGKSTLLKSIMGLLPPSGGNISVSTPRERIAYLPQLAEIDRSFPLDVRDCVLLGCWPARGAWGDVGPAELARIDAALEKVGLAGFEDRPVSSLSSGQFQRVLFARLLVQDAELILLDEPFNAIDSKTSTALLELIGQWHAQRRTVIAVLHDDAVVREHFPQTVLLARELVDWGPTDRVMTATRLLHARKMAEAWDEAADLCTFDDEPAARQNRQVLA